MSGNYIDYDQLERNREIIDNLLTTDQKPQREAMKDKPASQWDSETPTKDGDYAARRTSAKSKESTVLLTLTNAGTQDECFVPFGCRYPAELYEDTEFLPITIGKPSFDCSANELVEHIIHTAPYVDKSFHDGMMFAIDKINSDRTVTEDVLPNAEIKASLDAVSYGESRNTPKSPLLMTIKAIPEADGGGYQATWSNKPAAYLGDGATEMQAVTALLRITEHLDGEASDEHSSR